LQFPHETFVFEAPPDQNEVVNFTELDHNGYQNFEDAERGHEKMVEKWSQ
jgi:hypothetical protein